MDTNGRPMDVKDPECQPHGVLSPRELVILQLLSRGYAVTQVAKLLGRSSTSVETEMRRIASVLNESSIEEMVAAAVLHRLILE